MDALKIGDRVRLKTGGPEMTVAEIDGDSLKADHANCYWFRDGDRFQSQIFHKDTLVDAGDDILRVVFTRPGADNLPGEEAAPLYPEEPSR